MCNYESSFHLFSWIDCFQNFSLYLSCKAFYALSDVAWIFGKGPSIKIYGNFIDNHWGANEGAFAGTTIVYVEMEEKCRWSPQHDRRSLAKILSLSELVRTGSGDDFRWGLWPEEHGPRKTTTTARRRWTSSFIRRRRRPNATIASWLPMCNSPSSFETFAWNGQDSEGRRLSATSTDAAPARNPKKNHARNLDWTAMK